MDSNSNLSFDLDGSTSPPIEKCSLNPRRGKKSDAPKRRLLTGFIIYASEVRKQVIDTNPDQNFGDISRLVGNKWRDLPTDIRTKYHQRALIHNKRVKERAQLDLNGSNISDRSLTNGCLSTQKMSKKEKLAKEQLEKQQQQKTYSRESLPSIQQSACTKQIETKPQSDLQSQSTNCPAKKTNTSEISTQTNGFRFVEPPTKKRLVYSDTFKKYLQGLEVQCKDVLTETELPTKWLGAGIGRHESPKEALWALRDFMMQDTTSLSASIAPYN